jgi:hypothetical protein
MLFLALPGTHPLVVVYPDGRFNSDNSDPIRGVSADFSYLVCPICRVSINRTICIYLIVLHPDECHTEDVTNVTGQPSRVWYNTCGRRGRDAPRQATIRTYRVGILRIGSDECHITKVTYVTRRYAWVWYNTGVMRDRAPPGHNSDNSDRICRIHCAPGYGNSDIMGLNCLN